MSRPLSHVIWLSLQEDAPILTTGDAVASFMKTPDQFSDGKYLMSMDSIRQPQKWYDKDKTFDRTPKLWLLAISRFRWVLGISL